MIRKHLIPAIALAIGMLSAQSAGAAPGFDVRRITVADYPTVRLVVHSSDSTSVPTVFEDGKAVPSADVQNLGLSKAIVLAIDRSQSMTGAPLARAGAAAEQLLSRKRRSDRVAVVTFGSTALTQAPFAQATIDATTSLRTLSTDPKPGTALYDAVVVSAADLGAQALPGKVLVLLTDGRDVGSLASYRDALRSLRHENVVVYAIALGDARTAPLRRLARETGGSFFSAPTPNVLAQVYRRIGSQLDHTWRVSYETTARPGDRISLTIGNSHGQRKSVVVPGRRSAPNSLWIPRSLLGGLGGALLLTLAIAALTFLAARRAGSIPHSERIKQLVRAHTDGKSRLRGAGPRQRPTLAALAASIDRRLHGFRRWSRIERLVETAGLPVSAAVILVGAIGIAFVLAVLAALAAASAFWILFLFLLGLVAPFVAIRVIAGRRIRSFEDQLPDVLATVAGSLRVGHGLRAALQTVATEGAPPASVELRRVLAEARLGRPLEEALVSMCERLGSEDLLYVASAVEVQSQVGGSLAGVFGTVADTVRQRQQHRRQVRALTATGRATATVLSMLPVMFVALLLLVNPNYILPFLGSGLGHLLLVYSVVSISIGAFLLTRVVKA